MAKTEEQKRAEMYNRVFTVFNQHANRTLDIAKAKEVTVLELMQARANFDNSYEEDERDPRLSEVQHEIRLGQFNKMIEIAKNIHV